MKPAYEKVMKKSIFLGGLSGEELDYAVDFFGGYAESFKAGEILLAVGMPLTRFGMVMSGFVQVCMDDAAGNQMIMAGVPPGETFAEALCYFHVQESPLYIKAMSDSEIMWFNTEAVRKPSLSQREADLVNRLIAVYAERALRQNNRIQVLSKKHLRDKVMTMLTQRSVQMKSRTFEIPFDRSDMAVYLGCDRAALSRELSAMKREGLIDYYKNSFKLL